MLFVIVCSGVGFFGYDLDLSYAGGGVTVLMKSLMNSASVPDPAYLDAG